MENEEPWRIRVGKAFLWNPDYKNLPPERPPCVLEGDWAVIERRKTGRTRKSIAEEMGVSIERIRQREDRGLVNVRTWLRTQ
jgi:hypothetical protein